MPFAVAERSLSSSAFRVMVFAGFASVRSMVSLPAKVLVAIAGAS